MHLNFLSVDDSALQTLGLVEFGTQHLSVKLKDGRVFTAANELRGQMELDKKFAPGETALVIVPNEIAADEAPFARCDASENGHVTPAMKTKSGKSARRNAAGFSNSIIAVPLFKNVDDSGHFFQCG